MSARDTRTRETFIDRDECATCGGVLLDTSVEAVCPDPCPDRVVRRYVALDVVVEALRAEWRKPECRRHDLEDAAEFLEREFGGDDR